MYVECVEDGSKSEPTKRAGSGPLGTGWIAAAGAALLLAVPAGSGAIETTKLDLTPQTAAEEGPKVRHLEASRGSGTVTLPDTLEEDATSFYCCLQAGGDIIDQPACVLALVLWERAQRPSRGSDDRVTSQRLGFDCTQIVK